MKILNIHGYGGSAENSACLALKELGHEVISPQIDYDAERPAKMLDNLWKILIESKPDYIVGTSLGGFVAGLFAKRSELPVTFVNPCFMPFYTLLKFGYDESKAAEFLKLFPKLFEFDFQNTTAIIGGQDEVIDYHDTVTRKLIKNCTVIPDGKHSGGTLPLKEFFGEVIK